MKVRTKSLAAVTQFAAAALVGAACLNAAHAADSNRASVMNQTATYEQTLAFYLHPAHGFPGASSQNGQHPAILIKRKGVDPMYAFSGHLVGHAAIGDSRASAQENETVVARAGARPGTTLLSHPAAAQRAAVAIVR